MVANAGITLKADGADVTEDDYRRLMSVNLDGVLFGAQAAARQMKARGKGESIVLMASMGGIHGAGTAAYSTSKGGVVFMTKALADALGPDGIRVNAVAPGTIDTVLLRTSPGIAEASEGFRKRTPLRRLGQPSEIGDAVAFLGSDLSSYITGQPFSWTAGSCLCSKIKIATGSGPDLDDGLPSALIAQEAGALL